MEDEDRLTVEVTPDCHARMIVYRGGRPGLVIDYGGYELALIAGRTPQDAHEFAVGLAYASLCFASRCRALIGPDR